MENKKMDYVTFFGGGKLTNKRDANITGLAFFFGIIGIVLCFLVPIKDRFLSYSIIVVFILIGFLLGNKLFKKPQHGQHKEKQFERRVEEQNPTTTDSKH